MALPLRKGPSGPKAPSYPTGEDARVVPFTFASGIIALEPLFGGETLYRADIKIVLAFDSPVATVSLGTVLNPSLILGPADSNPSILGGQFENLTLFPFVGPDTLLLSIAPNGATMGSGLLLYELHR